MISHGKWEPSSCLQTQQCFCGACPRQVNEVGDSDFSKVGESPLRVETRTNILPCFPFPRQGYSTKVEEWISTNRYTAPAVSRAPSRDEISSTTFERVPDEWPYTQRPSFLQWASGANPKGLAHNAQPILQYSCVNGEKNVSRPTTCSLPSGPSCRSGKFFLFAAASLWTQVFPRSANDSPTGMPLRSVTQSPGLNEIDSK